MPARSDPATIAKSPPSRSASPAALAARLAATNRSPAIDADVSTMMTSAAPGARAVMAAGPPSASTITMAWTWVSPAVRYLFWGISIRKSGRSLTESLMASAPARSRRTGGAMTVSPPTGSWRSRSHPCSRAHPVGRGHQRVLGVTVLGVPGEHTVGALERAAQPIGRERGVEQRAIRTWRPTGQQPRAPGLQQLGGESATPLRIDDTRLPQPFLGRQPVLLGELGGRAAAYRRRHRGKLRGTVVAGQRGHIVERGHRVGTQTHAQAHPGQPKGRADIAAIGPPDALVAPGRLRQVAGPLAAKRQRQLGRRLARHPGVEIVEQLHRGVAAAGGERGDPAIPADPPVDRRGLVKIVERGELVEHLLGRG